MRASLILTLLVSGPVFASGNPGYSFAPMAQVAGGHSASGNYTIDIAMDAGQATDASPITMRAGFAGQLHDPVAISLDSNPALIAEGDSVALRSRLMMDDGNWNPLPSAEVLWEVLGGPVAISLEGTLTADLVYQDAVAGIVASYGQFESSLAMTVLNIDPDNLPGYSGDGIDDAWQVQYFGLHNPNGAPFIDPDGDGYSNLFEYHAGLVPVDAASSFHLRIEKASSQATAAKLTFWPILPGRSYTVLRSPTMNSGTWQALTGAPASDSGGERTVTDTNALPNNGFYRVDVLKN